jgi:hypothetical protein
MALLFIAGAAVDIRAAELKCRGAVPPDVAGAGAGGAVAVTVPRRAAASKATRRVAAAVIGRSSRPNTFAETDRATERPRAARRRRRRLRSGFF